MENSARGIAKRLPVFETAPLDEALLYPANIAYGDNLPRCSEFEVFSFGRVGLGIRVKRAFTRGTVLAKFTGQLMTSVLQHTLQVTPTSHLHDPHFIGLLSHACAPNCLLDMAQLELLALTDIPAGSTLTVDYALTEDLLFRQFPCDCGAGSCRHWITGRRERVNAEGQEYLSRRMFQS